MRNRRNTCFTLLAALSLTAAVPASGAVVSVPPSLEVGDQYRIVFVTSDAFLTDATSTDIDTYNTLAEQAANSVAELAALNTTWRAIVSVPDTAGSTGVSAKDNTGTDDSPAGDNGVPLFMVDGTIVANHYDNIWDNDINDGVGDIFLTNGIDLEEDGTESNNLTVWSGTLADGEINTFQPLGGTGFFTGRGAIGEGDGEWIATVGGGDASVERPIYVISDVLTVVPEPGSMALLALGGLFIGVRRRRDS